MFRPATFTAIFPIGDALAREAEVAAGLVGGDSEGEAAAIAMENYLMLNHLYFPPYDYKPIP